MPHPPSQLLRSRRLRLYCRWMQAAPAPRLLPLAGALHARRQREARDPSRAVAGLPL